MRNSVFIAAALLVGVSAPAAALPNIPGVKIVQPKVDVRVVQPNVSIFIPSFESVTAGTLTSAKDAVNAAREQASAARSDAKAAASSARNQASEARAAAKAAAQAARGGF